MQQYWLSAGVLDLSLRHAADDRCASNFKLVYLKEVKGALALEHLSFTCPDLAYNGVMKEVKEVKDDFQ
jgi:hypothetical protein